jgi:hypothetical protein
MKKPPRARLEEAFFDLTLFNLTIKPDYFRSKPVSGWIWKLPPSI